MGVGFGLWSAKVGLEAVANGLHVRLSSFTTNFVSVDYVIEAPGQTLASGTVEFVPGEMVKHVPSSSVPSGVDLVRVKTRNPIHASITGLAEAWATRDAQWVPAGAAWKYLDTGTNAGVVCRERGYDDSAWPTGEAELGYGDGQVTEIGFGGNSSAKHITYYFRHAFAIADAAAWDSATVSLKRDDVGIVYLNGAEIFRRNITNAPVNHLTRAFLAEDDGAG